MYSNKLLKSALLLILLLCIPVSIFCQNKFSDYTFSDEELINIARLIYDSSYPEDSVTLSNDEVIDKDRKCGLGLIHVLEMAIQNQPVSSNTLSFIAEIRNTDDLDKTYETANFTIDYNDTQGDPDCVYEPTNTHPTALNIIGEPVPWYIYNLGENFEKARNIFMSYGFEEPGSIGLIMLTF